MTNVGKVTKLLPGGRAVIQLARASACGENCAMCKGGCAPTQHTAVVYDRIGVRPGDMVRVDMPDGVVLKSAFLVYILPLLLLFVCYGAAEALFGSAAVSAASAILGLVAGFLLLRQVDKRFVRLAEITKRLDG